MDVVYTRCCGLDIHKKIVVACLILSTDGPEPLKELRTFGAITADLFALADWLREVGWALIDGATISGDKVWMDWTQDGGTTWIQCGPFTVQAADHTYTSAAQSTNSSSLWQFRACGALVEGSSFCTPWW